MNLKLYNRLGFEVITNNRFYINLSFHNKMVATKHFASMWVKYKQEVQSHCDTFQQNGVEVIEILVDRKYISWFSRKLSFLNVFCPYCVCWTDWSWNFMKLMSLNINKSKNHNSTFQRFPPFMKFLLPVQKLRNVNLKIFLHTESCQLKPRSTKSHQ